MGASSGGGDVKQKACWRLLERRQIGIVVDGSCCGETVPVRR